MHMPLLLHPSLLQPTYPHDLQIKPLRQPLDFRPHPHLIFLRNRFLDHRFDVRKLRDESFVMLEKPAGTGDVGLFVVEVSAESVAAVLIRPSSQRLLSRLILGD